MKFIYFLITNYIFLVFSQSKVCYCSETDSLNNENNFSVSYVNEIINIILKNIDLYFTTEKLLLKKQVVVNNNIKEKRNIVIFKNVDLYNSNDELLLKEPLLTNNSTREKILIKNKNSDDLILIKKNIYQNINKINGVKKKIIVIELEKLYKSIKETYDIDFNIENCIKYTKYDHGIYLTLKLVKKNVFEVAIKNIEKFFGKSYASIKFNELALSEILRIKSILKTYDEKNISENPAKYIKDINFFLSIFSDKFKIIYIKEKLNFDNNIKNNIKDIYCFFIFSIFEMYEKLKNLARMGYEPEDNVFYNLLLNVLTVIFNDKNLVYTIDNIMIESNLNPHLQNIAYQIWNKLKKIFEILPNLTNDDKNLIYKQLEENKKLKELFLKIKSEFISM